MHVLLIDNNDSFTYNLVDMLRAFGNVTLQVIASGKIDLTSVQHYDKIFFSPGPGLPAEQPAMFQILEQYATTKHILGICLGMQAIGHFYGGKLYNMPQVMHGQTKNINIIDQDTIFAGLPEQIDAGLYHSWALDSATLPDTLQPLATSEDGVLMAIKHRRHTIFGVQFHPESHITPLGKMMIKNFLSL